jgi:hypothetical protein
MRALIAQHGSSLVVLVAFRQQPKAQYNDEQTDSLENLVRHINVLAEFNQNTTEYAHERCNGMQRKRRDMQCTKSIEPLQLFGDEDASAPTRWDCGEMDTICILQCENVD